MVHSDRRYLPNSPRLLVNNSKADTNSVDTLIHLHWKELALTIKASSSIQEISCIYGP